MSDLPIKCANLLQSKINSAVPDLFLLLRLEALRFDQEYPLLLNEVRLQEQIFYCKCSLRRKNSEESIAVFLDVSLEISFLTASPATIELGYATSVQTCSGRSGLL